MTTGVFVFLFLGWQLGLNDVIVGSEQDAQGAQLSQRFLRDAPRESVAPAGSPKIDFGEPVITRVSAPDEKFANVYIPRFGKDFVRTVAEGVDSGTALRSGIGHYPGTQMPGEIGNFALAAHRTTYGAPFNRIADLQVGDKIFVQTGNGWYVYTFRSMEYVRPSVVAVTYAVPQQAPNFRAIDRIMTMTSCNPQLSAAERIVAYSVFDFWQPLTAGTPTGLMIPGEGRQ